jgi:multimeric flavodoxin WrbA
MYGHIQKLAEAEQAGLKKAGIEADIYQYALLQHLTPPTQYRINSF